MIQYAHEYPRRLRLLHLGCGGHSFRNILPCYRYAPIDLVATCDVQRDRAEAYARQFGALTAYDDFARALAQEAPEAVVIVTGYDEDRRPTYPDLAIQAMAAGAHVFIEKPPAATIADVRRMMAAEREHDRSVFVGLKKMFFPAVQRVRDIVAREEFGGLTSIYVRYPQSLPPAADFGDSSAMVSFLDHLCHPASLLYAVAGPMESLYYQRTDLNGAVVAILRFRSGAVGSLHLVAGQSGTSPLERLEAVGRGANVVVDNGCRLTYYRPGRRGEAGYGRSGEFLGDDAEAPIRWEPEFSLGQLYNHGLFLLGYAPEIRRFAESALEGKPPELGGLDAALEVTALYEAFLEGEERLIPVRGVGAEA